MENKIFNVYKKEQTLYSSSMETFRRLELLSAVCSHWLCTGQEEAFSFQKNILWLVYHPRALCCFRFKQNRFKVDWQDKKIVLQFYACVWKVIYILLSRLESKLDRSWNHLLFLHKPGLFPNFCKWYEVIRSIHEMCELATTWTDVIHVIVQNKYDLVPFGLVKSWYETGRSPTCQSQEQCCPNALQLLPGQCNMHLIHNLTKTVFILRQIPLSKADFKKS